MTESFALSGIVFLLYFIVQFLKTQKKMYCFWINFTLLFLVLLRPVFLFLIPIILVFWVYLILKKEMHGYMGIILNIFVVSIIAFYGFNFQKQYGIFTLSTVSDVNQYMMLRDAKLISTVGCENVKLKTEVEKFCQHAGTSSDYFDEFIYLYTNYNYDLCQKLVQNSIKINLKAFLNYNMNRIGAQTINSNIGFWEGLTHNNFYPYVRFFCFPFILLYIFLIFYPLLFFKDIKNWELSILIYFIAIASLFAIILGAPNAWGRLIVPTIPVLLIMFGQSLSIFCKSSNKIK